MTHPSTPPARAGGHPATPARTTGQPRKLHLRQSAAAVRLDVRLTAPALAALERLRAVLTLRTGRPPSLSHLVSEALTAAAPAASANGGGRR